MARYNTVLPQSTLTTTSTLATPNQGQFIELTGTAPYTVIVPAAPLFNGSSLVFFNSTTGVVTLSTNGIGAIDAGPTPAGTLAMTGGSTLTMYSNGTNWIVVSNGGGGVEATTLTATSTVTLNPLDANVSIQPSGTGTLTVTSGATGTINNMTIGASTPRSGAFTSLAANSAVTLTANTAATNTTTGTLVITGGAGISGNLHVGGTINGSLVGGTASVTTLAASSTVSGQGFVDRFASPGPIGNNTASTVRGTTVTATGDFSGPGTNLTGTGASFTAGAANSVAWGNVSSKPNGGTFFYQAGVLNTSRYTYSNCGNINSGADGVYTYAASGTQVGAQVSTRNYNCNCNC